MVIFLNEVIHARNVLQTVQRSFHRSRGPLASQTLNLNVGGIKYSLFHGDIGKYPTSMFQSMINKKALNEEYVPIERDGLTFKYVHSFIVTGQLPRSKMGKLALDKSTLCKVKAEADYFGMHELKQECSLETSIPTQVLEGYERDRKQRFVSRVRFHEPIEELHYSVEASPLTIAFQKLWAPLCIGYGDFMNSRCIFDDKDWKVVKRYTIQDFVEAARARIVTGDNALDAHLVTDLIEEMLISWGSAPSARTIAPLAPGAALSMRLRRVEIHTAGDSYTHRACQDASSDELHVGTVVGVLDAEYTGGKMLVTHGSNTADLRTTLPFPRYQSKRHSYWVAMHRACTHSLLPVTSGTRVSLVYDIVRVPPPGAIGGAHDVGEGCLGEECWTDEDPDTREQQDWQDPPETWGYPMMTIVSENKHNLTRQLNNALTRHDSVTVGLERMYPLNSKFSVLRKNDRMLYDALKKDYDVQIVAVTIHKDRAGFFTDTVVDATVNQHAKGIYSTYSPRGFVNDKNLLVVPHPLTEQHVYDEKDLEDGPPDRLYLISALCVRKRNG